METSNLINLVKQNNDEAYIELLEQFKKMIHSIINEYDLDYGDYQICRDDLYQEASIALYEAAVNYDDKQENKFSTFAYVVIKRRVYRFYKRYKTEYELASRSIDDFELLDHNIVFKSYVVNENPVEYQRMVALNEAIKKGNSKITNEDKTILLMRMNNYSYREIAEKLGINRKRIDNRLTRLKKIYLNNNNK